MRESKTIDVQSFLDEHPFSGYQKLIFGLCLTVVLLDGFDTAAIGYVAPSLIAEWAITKADLGPVMSAALFGLCVGSLSAGPLADRFGRKNVLLGAVALMGLACLASSFSSGLDVLVVLRFGTGLGLGAAMPNTVTLMSEYCPASKRAMITNMMFCGFPLGAALGGFLAAWIIPFFGWRSVLVLGGAAPLALAAVMSFTLPESVRYMVSQHYSAERIRGVLARVSRKAADATGFVMHEPEPASLVEEKGGLALIFSRTFIVGTMMLWIAYFMGLVIFYGLINWMPILFKEGGVPQQQATLIAALFPLGGFGAIYFGWLMDRYNANVIVAIGFALTAVSIYVMGQSLGSVAFLMAAVFVAGVIMNTAQTSLPSLAAAFYPTNGRASGVSWMMGIGRFGGIVGSYLVAELARRKLGLDMVFLVVAIPGATAALAILVKHFARLEALEKRALVEAVGQ